ncbi:MAG: hypothetical protein ACK2UK_09250 [Candidatus Promineifilaceae bacterium]|jgi:hypothetical protein
MAKKVRRVKKKKQTAATVSVPESTAAAVAEKVSPAESFRQEYSYVVRDLRRMLLLSAAMFLLLIALNLLVQV